MDCDQRGCRPEIDDLDTPSNSFGIESLIDFTLAAAAIFFAIGFALAAFESIKKHEYVKSLGQVIAALVFSVMAYRQINWEWVGGLALLGGMLFLAGAIGILISSSGKFLVAFLAKYFRKP